MRIIFVLEIQSAINIIRKHILTSLYLKDLLNMSFDQRDVNIVNNNIFTLLSRIFSKIMKIFAGKQHQINLVDPQKRLEESLSKLLASSENDSKSIEQIFKNQLETLDVKISMSSRRIEESLHEIAKNTSHNFSNVRFQMDDTKFDLEAKFKSIETKLNKTTNELATIKEGIGKFQTNFETLQKEIYNTYNNELSQVKRQLNSLMKK